MIRSLRWRFFVVVWVLLVAGLVGLGTLLGRWSKVELNRVSSEARVERRIDDASRELAAAALLSADADSLELSQALAAVVSRDSLVLGAFVSDASGRIVASALPGVAPGELTVGSEGGFELHRDVTDNGRRMLVRVAGTGHLLDPRDSLDPRYLGVIPSVRAGLRLNDPVLPGDGRRATGVEGSFEPAPGSVLAARIRTALIIGSILAAIVTLAISRPLLGRVGELSRATDRLRGGDLGARVNPSGGDELGRLGASFNAMAERLEASETQRRQMVTDVAHELRTPLTNLVALLEAARDGVRPVDDELLAILQDETALLNRLVDDLRDLALADAGELTVAREPVDVAASVRRAVAAFDAGHGVVLDLPAEPVIAIADARRLGQVLRNLVRNAVTHSPEPGSVRVVVRLAASVPPGAAHPGGDMTPSNLRSPISVLVEDHGPGIPADQLDRIWERFYRVDPSRSRATGGMGLGLPVARRLVEAMGGEIRVESEVGQGSRFTVEFGSTRTDY